jgi:pimeloyl-ACP methyl ester carboxylesterase
MTTQVQPKDKTITANGLNLHYLDWGTAGKTTMLLLHGLRGHSHSWDDVSAAMCQEFHVLALDQRGRGESDWAPGGDYSTEAYVADVAAFCDALNLDSFVLVGHSMGGRNSMNFTAKYPGKVQKLVIVDIGPEVNPKGGERIKQEITAVPEEFDSFEELFQYMNKQNQFASEAVLRRRLRYASKELPNGKFGWRYDLEVREQMRHGTGAPPPDSMSAWRTLKCPTLLVRGTETDILSAETAQQNIEAIPNGQLVEVQRAGHMVMEDNPSDFIAALRGFLS